MDMYHIYNRGVDKRQVFLDDSDHIRFLRGMFVFNDIHSAPTNANKRTLSTNMRNSRSTLVNIYAYCLMPNHYHILISENQEGGISNFMKKLNMGYSKYFNEKNKRSGALWQGKYKKVLMQYDAQFLYIPYYIHLNPLDLTHPRWREGKVNNINNAINTLSLYRWSSHLDYLGIHNFPSIINTNLVGDILGNKDQYIKQIKSIISDSDEGIDSSYIEFK